MPLIFKGILHCTNTIPLNPTSLTRSFSFSPARNQPATNRGPLIVAFQPSMTLRQPRAPTYFRPNRTVSAPTVTGWASWARRVRNGTAPGVLRASGPAPTTARASSVTRRPSRPAPAPASQVAATVIPTTSYSLGASPANGGGNGGSGTPGQQQPPSNNNPDQNNVNSAGSASEKHGGLSPEMIGVIVGVVLAVLLISIAAFIYLRKADPSDPYRRWNTWKEGKSLGLDKGSVELKEQNSRRSSAGYVDSIYGRHSADFQPYIVKSPGARASMARASLSPGSGSPSSSKRPISISPDQGRQTLNGAPRRSIVAGRALPGGFK